MPTTAWMSSVRRALPPWLAVLAVLDLFWLGLRSASYAPLGRDQGIFQYTAWAITQGDRLYVDLREVNGPLTHLVHLAFLALGGASTHGFRSLDLASTLLVYAGCVWGLTHCLRGDGPAAMRPSTWATVALGTLALGVHYLGYLGWDQAQRESFSCWFLLPALLLTACPTRTRGVATLQAALAGSSLVLALFGKPTMVAFVPAMLWPLTIGPWRTRRVLGMMAGGAFAAAAMLAVVACVGSPWRALQLNLVEAPALYTELWRKSTGKLLMLPWLRQAYALAAIATLTGAWMVVRGVWPRRLLGVAVAPALGVAALLLQGKGFAYHAHPITVTAWLVLVGCFYTLHQRALQRASLPRLLPLAALCLAFVASARFSLAHSPHHYHRDQIRLAAAGVDERAAERLARFELRDFHPVQIAQAATWLQEHTPADARVQIYGIDPLLLFWAQRRLATPYLYEYDWNVGLAVEGAEKRHGAHAPQVERIQAMGELHRDDALRRLEAAPAAAWVLFDGAPFMTAHDALTDLQQAAPGIAAHLQAGYREVARFGTLGIWMPAGDRARSMAP